MPWVDHTKEKIIEKFAWENVLLFEIHSYKRSGRSQWGDNRNNYFRTTTKTKSKLEEEYTGWSPDKLNRRHLDDVN